MSAERLGDYRAKRDFQATPEPEPAPEPAPPSAAGREPPERAGRSAGESPAPRFVVQEHSARRLHWDLRLEHDGTLASWALPRGVPDDPAANRKAVRTEDHPLEYLHFHGEIPAGSYGAGTMKIWDHGTYELEKWRANEVIAVFGGQRLRGRYALFRAGEARDWIIHRMDPVVAGERDPLPAGVVPMLARAGGLPVDEEGWAYEIKWDGVRAIAYVTPGELRLESRNLRDITASYPEVRALARALGSRAAVLDGEIVAFDRDGRPSFGRLQERMHVASDSAARRRAQSTPAVYLIFDLLYLDGRSLMATAYSERRRRLEELGLHDLAWQTPSAQHGQGAALLAAADAQGLEGLVAKRLDGVYEPGRRSTGWIKIKNTRRQELVIGGWMPGEGRRLERIGALLLGYHDAQDDLVYAGRVGTGFTDRVLDDLGRRLGALRRPESPFLATALLPRGAQFAEPRLVAEIEFTEWTSDGQLRHPSYKGLREDKDPREVRREAAPATAAAAPAAAAARPGVRPAATTRGRPAVAQAATPGSGRGPGTVFEEVSEAAGGYEVTLDGRRLRLSNYDKVLFAESGFTKGDLIEYYARVAPAILPHLRDRAFTLKRYPNGVDGKFFYEKNCPGHRPDWVQTATIASGRGSGTIDYCLVQDAPTLVWAANLASIELHTSLARMPDPATATMMVFDLDPGPPAELAQCAEVALVLLGLFEGLGLNSVVKTSGGKGLQVYVPLNGASSFTETKAFARTVAELLAAQAPDLVVSRMTRSVRAGRVLVDWSQNDEHKTTVNVYSVRARAAPSVSTPVSWDAVRAAHESGDVEALRFTPAQVLERVSAAGDLFACALSQPQELPAL